MNLFTIYLMGCLINVVWIMESPKIRKGKMLKNNVFLGIGWIFTSWIPLWWHSMGHMDYNSTHGDIETFVEFDKDLVWTYRIAIIFAVISMIFIMCALSSLSRQ